MLQNNELSVQLYNAICPNIPSFYNIWGMSTEVSEDNFYQQRLFEGSDLIADRARRLDLVHKGLQGLTRLGYKLPQLVKIDPNTNAGREAISSQFGNTQLGTESSDFLEAQKIFFLTAGAPRGYLGYFDNEVLGHLLVDKEGKSTSHLYSKGDKPLPFQLDFEDNVLNVLDGIEVIDDLQTTLLKDLDNNENVEILDGELIRMLDNASKLLGEQSTTKEDADSVREIINSLSSNSKEVRMNALKDTIIHSLSTNMLTLLGVPLAGSAATLATGNHEIGALSASAAFILAPYPTWLRTVALRGRNYNSSETLAGLLQSWLFMTSPIPVPGVNSVAAYPSSIMLQQSRMSEFGRICRKYPEITGANVNVYTRIKDKLFTIASRLIQKQKVSVINDSQSVSNPLPFDIEASQMETKPIQIPIMEVLDPVIHEADTVKNAAYTADTAAHTVNMMDTAKHIAYIADTVKNKMYEADTQKHKVAQRIELRFNGDPDKGVVSELVTGKVPAIQDELSRFVGQRYLSAGLLKADELVEGKMSPDEYENSDDTMYIITRDKESGQILIAARLVKKFIDSKLPMQEELEHQGHITSDHSNVKLKNGFRINDIQEFEYEVTRLAFSREAYKNDGMKMGGQKMMLAMLTWFRSIYLAMEGNSVDEFGAVLTTKAKKYLENIGDLGIVELSEPFYYLEGDKSNDIQSEIVKLNLQDAIRKFSAPLRSFVIEGNMDDKEVRAEIFNEAFRRIGSQSSVSKRFLMAIAGKAAAI